MDVVSIVSDYFNIYFPIALIALTGATYFSLGARLLSGKKLPRIMCNWIRGIRMTDTRIMISKGMVSKGQSTQIGPGKGFQYSF